MARRGVIRSRAKAIEKRSRPGAAAREYVSTAAERDLDRQRMNMRTEGRIDQYYSVGGTELGGGIPGRQHPTGGGLPRLDPRMGYGMTPQGPPARGPIDLPEYGALLPQREYGTPLPMGQQAGSSFVMNRNVAHEGGDPSRVNEIWEKNAQDELSFYDTYMQAQMDRVTELMQLREAAIAEGRADVASQYNDQISALQDDIDAAAKSKIAVAEAFERYRGTVDPYLQASADAAASIDLSKLANFQGAEPVTEEFNSGVEAVDSVLAKIGAEGNVDLAAHVEGQVREFQAMAEDAMREDMSNAFEVAEQGAVFAKAMAESLQQQDITMTDVERQKIEIDINKQIEQLQEQLADTKRARDKALAAVDRQVAESFGLPGYWEDADDAWGAVFGEWIGMQGLSPEDQEITAEMVDFMRQQGLGDRASAQQFIRDMVRDNNLEALNDQLGGTLWDFVAEQEELGNMALRGALMSWALDTGNSRLFRDVPGVPPQLAEALKGEYDSVSNYAPALDAWDLYREHQEKWDQYGNSSRSYGHAIADSYGFMGGNSSRRGKLYQGAELEQLFADAINYEFRNDPEMAQAYLGQIGSLAKLVNLESGGYVGRLNTSGARELGIDSYDTEAALKYLESAQHGQFSAVGWPAGRDGKRHSASGLGQLNASNYKRYAAEFGGAAAVGNPFAEAVAMLRYIRASYGVPSKALAYRLRDDKRGY